MSHNQIVHCEQAILPSDSTPHSKKNGVLKQVAYNNYTLDEFKKLFNVLGDIKFVDKCKLL